MSIELTKLQSLGAHFQGELKLSRQGQHYLVINLGNGNRVRTMYFSKSRTYKVYLDKGISSSTTIGRSVDETGAKSIIANAIR
jgi:hypothetical protein